MPCRGVRGAICAESNELHTIIDATRTLLQRIVDANSIQREDVAGIVFTATPDLDAAYPELARVLKPGGKIHAASDHLPYFKEIYALLKNDDRFEETETFIPAEDEVTDFELIFSHKV